MGKQLLLTIISAFALTHAFSQRVTIPAVKTNNGYSMPTNMYAPNNVDNPYFQADIQAQFNQGQWTRGTVKFNNGHEGKDLMLLFDVHSNKLYFLQDKVTMEFMYPVFEFRIGLVMGPDTAMVLYRSSYPSIYTNNAETFYEVVVDGGTMQLLWCRAKNVKLYKDNRQPEQERNTEKEQWYVYLPEGKMVKIKKDKNEILKALPEYSDRINKIVKEKGLRLKQTEDMIDLFAMLNRL